MIFALPPTAVWEISHYLWNSDGQGTLTAWTFIITSYYPIQLWWSRYSALDELGGGVGVIFALPPTAIWEISNYLWNSDDVDLYYYTLIHIAAVTFMLILLLGDVVKYSFVDTLIKKLLFKIDFSYKSICTYAYGVIDELTSQHYHYY